MTDMTPMVDALGALFIFGCSVFAAGIYWLHKWMRTLERTEGEDNDE